MRPFLAASAVVMAMLLSGCVDRANDEHPPSSYPELQASEVRGLSPEQIEGLRNGDGMGYALPAELNGYPGPKHVLDMASELGLNESQRAATASIRSDMLEAAKTVGADLIDVYEELDHAFRSQGIDEERLALETERIGLLEGRLRAIHMSAHLEMMQVLTHEQIVKYSELRGYASGGHAVHAH